MIASRDEPVVVRCASSGDEHHLRWVKLIPTDADAAGGARRVEVSTRRRLILDANVADRDSVYLCILTARSSLTSTTAARLAANVTVISPCKHCNVNVVHRLRLISYFYCLSIFIFSAQLILSVLLFSVHSCFYSKRVWH